MMFLAGNTGFWDEVFEILGKLVQEIFNNVWILLCQLIYPLISWVFSVFTRISTLELLDRVEINDITNRFTVILTIVMTFYITFQFVKYTVSPDTIADKDKGAMPLFGRIIIAILLLAFVPTIFTYATKIQAQVVERNIIGRIIMKDAANNNYNAERLGANFSGHLFGAFIHADCDRLTAKECSEKKAEVQTIVDKFKSGNWIFRTWAVQLDMHIQFNGLLAVIFGGFCLYVIFLYCKDVALRHIQLLFLQIISPIAILSYVSPKKDGVFQKWVKQCITTYLDLFIRLAVLYFMFMMIDILADKILVNDISQTMTERDASVTVYLFLIAGLMIFLKKAPKLIQELFPSGGAASIGYGFSAKDRKGILGEAFSASMGVAARGAGAIAGVARTGKAMKNGTLTSAADKNKNGKISRMRKLATGANAMIRSGVEGFKAGKDGNVGNAIRAGQEKVQSYEGIVARGGTVLGHDFRAGHYQDEKVSYQVKIDWTKGIADSKSTISNYADEVNIVKQAKAAWESAKSGGADEATIESLRQNYKKLQKSVITQTVQIDSITGENYITDLRDKTGNTKIILNGEDLSRKQNTDAQIQNFISNARTDITSSEHLGEEYKKDFEIQLSETVPDPTDPTKTIVKIVTKKFSELSDDEIKNSLGDIETAALNAQRDTERKLDYIKANANSEGKK